MISKGRAISSEANVAHKNETNISPYTTRRGSKKTGVMGKHKRPVEDFSFAEADDRIFDVFRNHDFANISHEHRNQFTRFYQLLIENQKKTNLTRLVQLKDIALKHFIDCMMVTRLIDLQFPLLDIGTGPGFPGIPLAILHPTETLLLAEGVQKRVDFLKTAREHLKLSNVKIIGRNIDPEFQYPVKTVITRAVEDIGNTLRNCQNSLTPGGIACFMKGPQVDPEIDQAIKDQAHIFKFKQTITYSLPNSPHQRKLVLFEKLDEKNN